MSAIVSNMVRENAEQTEKARLKRIAKAQGRYDGVWPNPLQKTKLDPSGADNTKVNYARKTVDVSAYYLFGKEVGFETISGTKKEADASTDNPSDLWLDACWAANDKDTFLLEFATGAGIAGDGFIRVLEPDTKDGFPRLISLDPANVSVVYDTQDYRRALQFKIEWPGMDAETNQPTAYRILVTREESMGPGEFWTITEQESAIHNYWVTTVPARKWPFPFCPIFHTKNRPAPNTFWGLSDLEDDVLHINEQLNFTLSNTNRILRAHGHPLSVVAGQSVGEVSRGIGDMLYLPNPDASVKNIEMMSDLSSSQEQRKLLQELYHELVSIPEVASGKMENTGQLSGFALQILYGPLIALTNVKRMCYGAMLKRLCMCLCLMGKQQGVTDIQIQWPNLLPVDRAAEAATATALQDAGVSKSTTLSELGYEPDDEAQKSSDEADAALERQKQAFDRGNLTGSQNPFGGGNVQGGGNGE